MFVSCDCYWCWWKQGRSLWNRSLLSNWISCWKCSYIQIPWFYMFGQCLLTKEGRSNLMSEFRKRGLFANVIMDEVNEKVANLVIVPRICLKHSCEEYSKMDLCKLKCISSTYPRLLRAGDLIKTNLWQYLLLMQMTALLLICRK